MTGPLLSVIPPDSASSIFSLNELIKFSEVCVDHPVLTPTLLVSCYLLWVCFGPILVQASGIRVELRWVLAGWNLLLCLMSLAFLLRVGYVTTLYAFEAGLYGVICLPDGRFWRGEGYFIVYAFFMSKVIEYGDTFFLVLRGKPVVFLHWYHHCTVLVFTWYSLVSGYSGGWIFGLINSGVHVVMYFYYFYSGLTNTRPFWGVYITQLQLLQVTTCRSAPCSFFNC